MTDLAGFLKASENSVSREALFRHRFLYDVGVAAAASGYAMGSFVAEVDRDGHDIVLEDEMRAMRRIQLKTTLARSSTKSWEIQRHLLRPSVVLHEKLGFRVGPNSVGAEGAVVLQVLTPAPESVSVEYYVCDVFILKAHCLGVVSHKQWPDSRGRAGALLAAIVEEAARHGKVTLPLAAFIRVGSVAKLLAVLGLHTHEYPTTGLRFHVPAAISGAESERAAHEELVAELLRWAVDDSRVTVRPESGPNV